MNFKILIAFLLTVFSVVSIKSQSYGAYQSILENKIASDYVPQQYKSSEYNAGAADSQETDDYDDYDLEDNQASENYLMI